MTKYPTNEHRTAAIELVFEKFQSMQVTPMLLLNIEVMIQNQMIQLVQCGEISKVPMVRVEKTVIGSIVNDAMEWVPVYRDTSLTVNFLDPDTMETI